MITIGKSIMCVLVCSLVYRAAAQPVDYVRAVKPILREKCYICHGPGLQNAGLRFDEKASADRVIHPDRRGQILLLRRIKSADAAFRMPPPMAVPLAPGEVDVLDSWIRDGARWLEPPATSEAARLLFAVIDADDLDGVKRHLTDRSLLETRDAELETPLMHAALNASPRVLELLLQQGADPNACNPSDLTPLVLASNDLAKIKSLIAAGANVNATTKEGTIALIAAAGFPNSTHVIGKLLASGANPNASNSDGATALVEASAAGSIRTMKLLLAHGADAHRVRSGLSPLSAAAYYGNSEAVRLLLANGVGANEVDGLGVTALHAAALVSEREIASMLIERCADANIQAAKPFPSGQYPGTPIAASVYTQRRNGEMARLLIAHGADINAVTGNGDTALQRAQCVGAKMLIDILDQAGGKPGAAEHTEKPRRVLVTGPQKSLPGIPETVEKTLLLLQRSGREFIRKSGCVSCHNQAIPVLALAEARRRGFHFDEESARQQSETARVALTGQRERAMEMMFIGGPVGVGYALLELAAFEVPRGPGVAAYIRNLAAQQLPRGNWRPAGARPPLEFSDITATALAIRSLNLYGWNNSHLRQIELGWKWLRSAKPESTEDASFQLLGLFWSGESPGNARPVKQYLLSLQNEDGGWGEQRGLESDAYSTGEALFALIQAGGMRVSDRAYERGIQFLRRTQLADGSWHVPSRTLKIQLLSRVAFHTAKINLYR